MNPVYLDCNATTPIDPEVKDFFWQFIDEEFGNEGSRTHRYGMVANQAVQKSREQIAKVVKSSRDEVIFTGGATESNNISILGLQEFGEKTGKKHIITSEVEHKSVLEPCQVMHKKGFELSLLPVEKDGYIDPENVKAALRDDTLLVSVMQVNNETGLRQPIEYIAEILNSHEAFFHTDAAQGFGKDIEPLKNPRVDMISISGHKVFAPKGIGALVLRRREFERPPISPIMFGGGQEKGLRPGTLPVALIAALGHASEIALRDHEKRRAICAKFRHKALQGLAPLNPTLVGDQSKVMDHVLNLYFSGLDSEAAMLLLKDIIAISNGSACTSSSYQTSHVLKAMGLSDTEANSCLRISWCHLTPDVDWDNVVDRLKVAL